MIRRAKLAAALARTDDVAWSSIDEEQFEELIAVAAEHQLHLVLIDILKRSPAWDCLTSDLRGRLEHQVAAASIVDLIVERELRKVLMHLDRDKIPSLLLKGVPLAYTLYSSPILRPRGDTDLLFREIDLQRVASILTELGYVGPNVEVDRRASYECNYRRSCSFGVSHNLDVHWKVSNAPMFARTFTFDELADDAIGLPTLAPSAIGLGYVHALLLACMHRFAHAHAPFYVDGNPIYAGDHLRWVYDIHLLCSTLNPAQWVNFTNRAITKNVAVFCVDGLNAACEAFNTDIPDQALSRLQAAARTESANISRLRASGTAWLLANWRALPDLSHRIASIKHVVLPPPSYMMKKYQTNSWLKLPYLYAYRAINGVVRTVRRPPRTE
jgi:hypothetical protein